MQSCTQCGRPRNPGAGFCTGCGAEFPGADPGSIPVSRSGQLAPDSGRTQPPSDVVGFPGGRFEKRPPSRRSRWLVIAVIVAAIAAGGAGAGVWLHIRHGHAGAVAARGLKRSAGQSPAAGPATPQASQASPAAPSSPTAPVSAGDTVTVSADAAQDPAVQSVVTFLQEYFTVINSHDYQGYAALLSPPLQQGMTPAQFNSGYDGTVDSGETLESISTAPNGDTIAAVRFTSHQNPDSLNHEQACTSWSISLFLVQNGTGYLIDQSPSGYLASSAPC
jgi:hypothetical protein